MAAVTADQVQVVLDAKVQKYIADLKSADATFARITDNMERDAASAGAAFTRIQQSADGAFSKVAAKAPATARGIEGVTGQVANLGAQFQDIAVQLQSGTSPLTIALQQGTQISAVLGMTGGGAGGAVKALGAAFASIVSPVSLATIAIIALGGFAVQYLTGLADNTKKGTEALREHAKELQKIVEGYDGAGAALDEYLNQLNRLPGSVAIQELQANFLLTKKAADDFFASVNNFGRVGTRSLNDGGRAIERLVDNFQAGNITLDQFIAGLAQVRLDPATIQRFRDMAAALEDGAIAAGNLSNLLIAISSSAAEIARNGGLQFSLDARFDGVDAAVDALKGLTPELRDQRQIIEDTYNKGMKDAVLQSQKDLIQTTRDSAIAALDEQAARTKGEEAARKSIATGNQLEAQKEREREAVEALIAGLEFELSLIGLSNQQKAVEIALRQAGAAATDEQRAAIEALVIATHTENETLKQTQELYDAIKGAADGALKGFLHDIAEGKSAGEAFKGMLDDILSKLIDFGVSTALNAIFPGLGTLAGQRAAGGPVNSGSSYLVGEKGPEIFTPTSAGRITSNADAAGMGGGGKLAIYLGPGLQAEILDQSARQSVQIVQSMTPAMIAQGSGAAAAKSQRDRVA